MLRGKSAYSEVLCDHLTLYTQSYGWKVERDILKVTDNIYVLDAEGKTLIRISVHFPMQNIIYLEFREFSKTIQEKTTKIGVDIAAWDWEEQIKLAAQKIVATLAPLIPPKENGFLFG